VREQGRPNPFGLLVCLSPCLLVCPGVDMAQQTKTATILIVDDEPLIRATLTEYLAQEGHRVTACGDGEQALALAARQPFDVALCDVQLPGIDGLQVLERLLKPSPQTFVLLITAFGTVQDAVGAVHP